MIAKKSKFLFSGEKQDVTAAGEGWGQIQIRSSDRPEVGEEAAKGADYPSQGGRSRLREVEERGGGCRGRRGRRRGVRGRRDRAVVDGALCFASLLYKNSNKDDILTYQMSTNMISRAT